jgi:hypothetical protein
MAGVGVPKQLAGADFGWDTPSQVTGRLWQTFRTALSCRMHTIERAAGADYQGALPSIVLEITRGRAKHLRRTVRTTAFLIGTANDCDLVLGDPRFPEVHSYLFVSREAVTIRQLGPGPALCVGGRAVTRATLDDLDTVQMGPYEFRVLIEWPQGTARDQQSRGAAMESVATPIRHEWAIQRLLDDVRRYSRPPRLTLFTGDGECDREDEPSQTAREHRAIWRQGQRKAIS